MQIIQLLVCRFKDKYRKGNVFILVTLLMIIIVSQMGCLRTYYPSYFFSHPIPQIYNTADSLEEIHAYFGGDLSSFSGQYSDENVRLGRGCYSIVNTGRHYNFNPRFFAYTGVYNVSGLEKFNGSKSVWGLGAEISHSLNFDFDDSKLGFGFNLGGFAEFGDYYEFRKQAGSQHIISDENSLLNLSFSFFPILEFDLTPDSYISIQTNFGTPGGVSFNAVYNSSGYAFWLSGMMNNNKPNITFGLMINSEYF